jgi:STE24 endopeptidase
MNEDRAARYHRLRRQATIASTLAGGAWLVALTTARWGANLPLPILTALVVAGWELATFPFTFYRTYVIERKYGVSSEPVRTWLRDHAKALMLGLALAEAAAGGVYWSMWMAGPAWWLLAAALFAVAGMVLARAAPVVLLPLFYRFKPLERETLRARLIDLSRRARVPVLGAFEWGLGEKTSRANAALVGAGGTRRILVSDTLLKSYSDDEIEVILAHEIAHHVHHDMWSALGLETLVVAASLAAAQVALVRSGYRPGDVAALPTIAMTAGVVSLLLAPLGNAWSRHNERRADRFALDLTQRPAAFVSAMRRLGAQNLAEERPSTAALWFFHSHPTIDERIAAAKRHGAAE